jgi:hypothetical protein
MPEDDNTIPHEAAVEEVIDQELEDLSTHAAIPDLSVPAGAAYVQAEATGTRSTTNAILAVLRDAGLIPSS